MKEFIYVAEMSQNILQAAKAAKAHLITRGPNQLKMVKQTLLLADEPNTLWSEPFQFATSKQGATYRLFETSALDQKKEKTLEHKRENDRC
ncbi:MAG: hypothetical protein ACE3JN_11150 [Ectobacillus sp.]